MMRRIIIIGCVIMAIASCKTERLVEEKNELKTFIIKNKHGAFAKITNLGGIIMELQIPTKEGVLRDVVLGYNDPQDYLNAKSYFGAIIGRYGNRIANGKFSLNGTAYQLPQNNGTNSLHGGDIGFDKKVWTVASQSDSHIVFSHRSEAGDQGFPGRLDVRVKYMIDSNNQLLINYRATTDKSTVVNLTNHSYFNLDGAGNGNILNHVLQIDANYINAVDANLIPTGPLMDVVGTPFDFNSPQKIGDRIQSNHPQMVIGNGYDHNYVLNNQSGELAKIATVVSTDEKVVMDILTTEPGVQLYTGNFVDAIGKGRKEYGARSGFCLETQHYPDSPNQSEFPSTVLNPGEVYESQTVYAFNY